ncbi:MAG: glycosyltransferase family 2 protein [Candidatus Omnitrophota bacterium]
MADLNPDDICVIIPAYNEEKNIRRVVGGVRALGYPVLVVDDGSSDRTADSARETGATEVLTADENQGKGAVIRRGLRWALAKNYPAAILMDADGQHDPRELGLFREALQRTDFSVIVGNRMGRPEGMPWVRRATNRFMSRALSAMTGQNIPDSQCGYRALKREVIEKITLETSRFEIESEMLLEAARRGFRIGSVPVRSVYEGGASKISPLRDTFRFFSFLFRYHFSKNHG